GTAAPADGGTNRGVSGGFAGITPPPGSGTLPYTTLFRSWTLGATQTYTDGGAGGSLTISGFGTLQGGSAKDTFNVTAANSADLRAEARDEAYTSGAPLTGSEDGQGDSHTPNLKPAAEPAR